MADSDEFWNRALATLARLDEQSYYELLGVEPTAGGVMLSDAYYGLVRQFHPDRHCREASPTRQQALVRIYARLTEAYRVLSNADQRRAYDASLRAGKTRLSPDQLSPKRKLGARRDPKTERARRLYERGCALLDSRQHAAARAQLELALAYEPDSRAIRAALEKIEPVRAHARYRVEKQVAVRCETWEQLEELYSGDISRGGMFIKSKERLEIGTPLSLQLSTPDGREIELKAEVRRWVPPDQADPSGPGLGVRFMELTKSKRDEISQLIEEQRAAQIEASLEELAEIEDEVEDLELPEEPEPEPIPSLLEEDDLFDERSFVGLAPVGRDEITSEVTVDPIDGESALRHGMYAVAVEMFGRAVKKRPDDRKLRANYHLAKGQVARSNGRMQDARMQFEAALKLDNSCHDAAYELRKLGQR